LLRDEVAFDTCGLEMQVLTEEAGVGGRKYIKGSGLSGGGHEDVNGNGLSLSSHVFALVV
jgi:hypothetical protein